MPACEVPRSAKRHGAKIIEISPDPTAFSRSITDLHLCGKATEMMNALAQELKLS